MSELKSFPFLNQLADKDLDHLPDENAREDCLPTCLAAALSYFTGKPYSGEEILHAVYGPKYVGPTAAVNYVQYVSKQGVKFSSVSGSPAYLVSQVHAHLAQGHAVIGTIPSCYCPPKDRMNPGSSHCIVFYKDSPGVLIAMNPWQAISQANSDTWWAERFCFDQVWIVEKGTMSGVPQGWKPEQDANGTITKLIAPNGKVVVLGFLHYVLAHAWHPENVPLEDEHPEGKGSSQLFRESELQWDSIRGVQEIPLGPELLDALNRASQFQEVSEQAHKALAQAESEKNTLSSEVAALRQAAAQPKPETDLPKKLTAISDELLDLVDSMK